MTGDVSIIPQVRRADRGTGFFRCGGIPLLRDGELFPREREVFRGQLRGDGLTDCPASGAGGREIRMEQVPGLGPEDYRLSIGEEVVRVEASSGAGMYHGLQSLRQLFLSGFQEGAWTLPWVDIADGPRFPWRGFMLDCARYFYTPEFIKKLLDALSLHHLNIFHWHLTDDQGWRLPVGAYPLLTEIGSRRYDHRRGAYLGGIYTREDIRDIVAYAADRHIEVVPEVDLPGHASSILAAYPGLGCTGGPYQVEDRFGIFEDVLCAGNDGLFDLAEKIFDTLGELFPSPWVHIGGDEVRFGRWEACPKCGKRLAETGLQRPRELQSWITVKLAGMLGERGKTAIGWDEILEDTPAFPLPPSAAVMSWRGRDGGIEASRRGHRVVMSPSTGGCYLDYKHLDLPEEPGQLRVSRLRQTYEMDPVDPAMTAEDASRVMGGQANLWSEVIYAGKIAEYMIFPRICALAEALWSTEKDFADFARRLPLHQRRLDHLDILQYRGPLE